MELKLITQKQTLLNFRKQILTLFEQSFGKPLSTKFWNWAYIDNPCGNPVVSLCIQNNTVLGHYAVIPFTLKHNNKKLKTVLSMTTMVAPEMRGKGLFTKQANQVYDHLNKAGYDYVIGFPNKNSLPGFKKHLQWIISESDYVAKVTKEQLINSNDFNQYIKNAPNITVPLSDPEYMQWRLSKPEQSYHQANKCIVKKFGDCTDLLYITDEYQNELDSSSQYFVLLDESIQDLMQYKQFDYPFGFKAFNSTNCMSFKKDLLLSDVF